MISYLKTIKILALNGNANPRLKVTKNNKINILPFISSKIWYNEIEKWGNKMQIQELNKEQQKAVNHIDGPMLVLAGASSGKT